MEGMWLNPGKDPYASARGESPDANTADPGEDLGRRLCSTPLDPSMACNLFGDHSRGTPRRLTKLHGDEGGSAHLEGDYAPVDDMDEDVWKDGEGPWQHVCAPPSDG